MNFDLFSNKWKKTYNGHNFCIRRRKNANNTLKKTRENFGFDGASSGQMISDSKCSSIFFSPNVDVDVKGRICEELNIMTEAISDKYLGLPSWLVLIELIASHIFWKGSLIGWMGGRRKSYWWEERIFFFWVYPGSRAVEIVFEAKNCVL